MDTTTAFVRSAQERAVELVVNFGPLSGREATLAEIDRLARRLLETAAHVRVHAIRTHDMGPESESIVHQVVVEADASARDAESRRATGESWAVACADERSVDPLPL